MHAYLRVYAPRRRDREVLLAHSRSSDYCEPTTVILAEIEAPELAAILGFVYTGSTSVLRERFDAFLRAAEALHIRLPLLPFTINDLKQELNYINLKHLDSLHNNGEEIEKSQANTVFRGLRASKFNSREIVSINDSSINICEKYKVNQNLENFYENSLKLGRSKFLINTRFRPQKSVESRNWEILSVNDFSKGIQKQFQANERFEESVKNSVESKISRVLVNQHMEPSRFQKGDISSNEMSKKHEEVFNVNQRLKESTENSAEFGKSRFLLNQGYDALESFKFQNCQILSTNKLSKNVQKKYIIDQRLDNENMELERKGILINQKFGSLEPFTFRNSEVLSNNGFVKEVEKEFKIDQNLEKSIKNSADLRKPRFLIKDSLKSFKSQSRDILSNNEIVKKVEKEFKIDQSLNRSIENTVDLRKSKFLINRGVKPSENYKFHPQNITSTKELSKNIQKEYKIDNNLEDSVKHFTNLKKERFPINLCDKSFIENEGKSVFRGYEFDSDPSRKLWTGENHSFTIMSSRISNFDRANALETSLGEVSWSPVSSLIGLSVEETENRVEATICEEDSCRWRTPRMQVANGVIASPWKQILRPHHSPRIRPILTSPLPLDAPVIEPPLRTLKVDLSTLIYGFYI
ncbi:hypothetical protein KM043_017686 [Ampulex compressa]|nr:hypothetical protein KM043_017686 [Ampulex compressa]